MAEQEERNTLIDSNGNAIEIDFDNDFEPSGAQEDRSGILSALLQKLWPSKDTRFRYELREKGLNSSNMNSAPATNHNRNSTGSWSSNNGFWSSLLTSFSSSSTSPSSPSSSAASSNRNSKSEEEMSCSSSTCASFEGQTGEGAGGSTTSSGDRSSPPSNRKLILTAAGDQQEAGTSAGAAAARRRKLDSIFNDKPAITNINNRNHQKNNNINNKDDGVKVMTRREIIRQQNRRFEQKLQRDQLVEANKKWNASRTPQGNHSLMEAHKRISLQSLAASENPDSINSNEFTHRAWQLRAETAEKENFYNVAEMDMYKLYKSGRQSDVTIRCRGTEFKAHSFVLKGQSAYLRRILFTQPEGAPILVNDQLPQDIEALLLYLYTGKVDHRYCDRDGGITRRFELLLQEYEVPFPEDSNVMIPIITTDFVY